MRNFVKWKRKFVIWGCLVCGKVLVFRLDLRWVSSVLYWVFVDLELGFLLVLLLAISSSSISNPPMLRSLFFSISLNVFMYVWTCTQRDICIGLYCIIKWLLLLVGVIVFFSFLFLMLCWVDEKAMKVERKEVDTWCNLTFVICQCR